MNGKFWISGLVVGILYFLLGWLIYGILLANVFSMDEMPGARTEPLIWSLLLAALSYGFLMAFTYPRAYSGGDTTKEGMRFGILFALIVNLPVTFFMYAFFEFADLGAGLLAVVIEMIIGAVLGVITAKIYGDAAKVGAPSAT